VRIFIAGIMQGSRREKSIAAQDYRAQLTQVLRRHLDDVDIIDPFVLHPQSVTYTPEVARQTLLALAEEAGDADVLIAFVPEASMGTAIEMWRAYCRQRLIYTISPLNENWVVRSLSTRVFPTPEAFMAFVASGEFRRAIESARTPP